MRLDRTELRAGPCQTQAGLTLVEVVSGGAILVMAIVSVLMAFLSQTTLNEHSRNLALATNDASRVVEQLQGQNGAGVCVAINVAPPVGYASWDAWLGDVNGGGGKSVPPSPATQELVTVTSTGTDPMEVTVSTCWRHRQRVLGECTWNGVQLTASDLDGNGVITSPATLSTSVTCR